MKWINSYTMKCGENIRCHLNIQWFPFCSMDDVLIYRQKYPLCGCNLCALYMVFSLPILSGFLLLCEIWIYLALLLAAFVCVTDWLKLKIAHANSIWLHFESSTSIVTLISMSKCPAIYVLIRLIGMTLNWMGGLKYIAYLGWITKSSLSSGGVTVWHK